MKIGTCEKCGKASACNQVKGIEFTGICPSFISYSKMSAIISRRNRIPARSNNNKALTHNPFTVLKNLEVK